MNPLLVATLSEQIFTSATIAESADGGLTIHSAPGRYIVWVIAFLVVLPLSAWCWRRRIGGRYAPSVFFASFAIILIVVPGIAMESVHVAPDALSIRTGLWFAPTDYRIPLTDLAGVIESEEAVASEALIGMTLFGSFVIVPRHHAKLFCLIYSTLTEIMLSGICDNMDSKSAALN